MKIYSIETDTEVCEVRGTAQVIRSGAAHRVVEGDILQTGDRLVLQEASKIVMQKVDFPDEKPITLQTYSPFESHEATTKGGTEPSATQYQALPRNAADPAAKPASEEPIDELGLEGILPPDDGTSENQEPLENFMTASDEVSVLNEEFYTTVAHINDARQHPDYGLELDLDTCVEVKPDSIEAQLESISPRKRAKLYKKEIDKKIPQKIGASISDAEIIEIFSPSTIIVS